MTATSANGSKVGHPMARTILVVEDNPWLSQEIAEYLQNSGYVVLDVGTGERALELCHGGTPVDILVTDINLPGPTNGWDVARTFRDAHAGIVVIYASAHAIDHARCVPGSRFFSKPYRSSDILEACRQVPKPGA